MQATTVAPSRPRFPLMEQLREDDHFSAVKFMDVMKLDVGTFAQRAKVHRNTVTKAPQSQSVQKPIREAMRVMAAMFDVTGDLQQTIYWFRNEPLPEFGYKTAEEVVADGNVEGVLRLITIYQAGFAG